MTVVDIYKARRSVTVDILHGQISMQHRLQLKYKNVQCHIASYIHGSKHNPIYDLLKQLLIESMYTCVRVATVCIPDWMGPTELPNDGNNYPPCGLCLWRGLTNQQHTQTESV